VLGISTKSARVPQEEKVFQLAQETAEYLEIAGGIDRESVVVDSDYVGAGYGIPTPEMIEAVKLTARHEAILLDPVYTGKGMAGLIGWVRQGRFKAGENVVFLHTGGNVGLFAEQEIFAD